MGPPDPSTPFWPLAPWPLRFTRYDVTANVVAYVPFGLFVALWPRRASPWWRAMLALACGLALSFAMETLQTYLPPRDASLVDLASNSAGALLGGLAGASLVRAQRVRRALSSLRHGAFLPGKMGDIGIALLALWLVAQVNPGIPSSRSRSIPSGSGGRRGHGARTRSRPRAHRGRAVGLPGAGRRPLVALLVRERRYVGGAVLLLVGAALAARARPRCSC